MAIVPLRKFPMKTGMWTLLSLLNKWQVISDTVHFLWYSEPGTVSTGCVLFVFFVKVESALEKATETSGLDFNLSPCWVNGKRLMLEAQNRTLPAEMGPYLH